MTFINWLLFCVFSQKLAVGYCYVRHVAGDNNVKFRLVIYLIKYLRSIQWNFGRFFGIRELISENGFYYFFIHKHIGTCVWQYHICIAYSQVFLHGKNHKMKENEIRVLFCFSRIAAIKIRIKVWRFQYNKLVIYSSNPEIGSFSEVCEYVLSAWKL